MKTLTSSLSLLALCAVAAPAAADITAAELWAEWQADFGTMGGEFAADVSETGNGLSVTNMQITSSSPGFNMTQSFGQVNMIDNGDGTVTVDYVTDWRFAVDFDVEGERGSVEFIIALEGDNHVVSGDVSAYTYTSTIERLTMSVGEVSSSNGLAPKLDLEFVFEQLNGAVTLAGARGERVMSGDQTLGGMTFLADIGAPPGETGAAVMQMNVGPAQMAFEMNYDELMAFAAAMSALDITSGEPPVLPPIYDFDLQSSYDSLNFDFQFSDGPDSFAATGQNGGGRYNVAIGDVISYDLGGRDMSLSVSGSEIPFPVSITAAETGLALTMPAVADPTAVQDFGLSLTYRDVAVNDQLWMMIDPTQAIPRDPITALVDLTGTAVLFTDLIGMDPTRLSGPPGELRSANLNTLDVSAAGARLTGSGAVEFAPGQIIPMPVGQIDLGLSGLNALLDSLSAAGLLPVEQAGMVRAMTGMFARPGAGPDTLETTIEFLPGGGITANGIPLQ